MNITKERIISIIISYFIEQKKMSPYRLASKVNVDQKSITAWAKEERSIIQRESVNSLISGLKDDINKEFVGISEFLVSELAKDGIDREYTWKIFNETKDMLVIIEKLQEFEILEQKYLQDKLGTAPIIENLKKFLSAYREYFQINDKGIGEGKNGSIYASLIYNPKNPKDSINGINYLVLKFQNAYNVGIILTNFIIDYSDSEKLDYYSIMIEKLKSQNDLRMLLFITDIDKKTIPVSVQTLLMKDYNLFFEFIKKKDLQKISIQGLKLREENDFSNPRLVDQHRYAQLIFERFMSYLSVISNEIIFVPYLQKLQKELDSDELEKVEEALNKILVSYKERTNINNFTDYANEVLIKEVCRYSYLSRHVIYYERNLITKKVEGFLEKRGIEKLSLVVEICAPNSLTTCNIIGKCEKLLLFTTSHSAYSLMTKLEEKTKNQFLPSNVSLHINHLNPEYMMYQYPEELNGKVDLLVIGYGAGSQISDLTRFARYAYNWLSENGILFISVYNKDAIILNKYHIHDQRFESSPLYISDYWTYKMNERPPLLKKLRAYSLENLQSSYLSMFDTENMHMSTYPYISALINPSEYSRTILDEIREVDKSFAKKGLHGQMIDVILYKNKLVKETDSKIKKYLTNLNIQYDCYSHTLAPDSKSLKRSLQEKNISISNATILKTVILQEKNPKSSHNNCWSYVILPYDKMVAYDNMKYELVPEIVVIKKYNQGTISPLAVLAERTGNNESNEDIFLSNDYRIDKQYVIMRGDSNAESIRIKTKDFLEIVEKTNIATLNTFE